MGENSKIEWTDTTWNVSVGCTLVSPGCIHCYAMGEAAAVLRKMQGSADRQRWDKNGYPTKTPSEKTEAAIRLYTGVTRLARGGKDDYGGARPVWTEKVNLCGPEVLTRPLHWKKPRRVFVNSMSDLFHESIPVVFIEKVFRVMELSPRHQFQVLTKRPARAAEILNRSFPDGIAPNVWIGTSAEDARRLEERVPALLAIKPRPKVLFLSAEPLISSLGLGLLYQMKSLIDKNGREYARVRTPPPDGWSKRWKMVRNMDWVIVGGESGKGARKMEKWWVQEIRDLCQLGKDKPAFFFKQWGGYNERGFPSHKNKSGRLLDGRTWTEFPAELAA